MMDTAQLMHDGGLLGKRALRIEHERDELRAAVDGREKEIETLTGQRIDLGIERDELRAENERLRENLVKAEAEAEETCAENERIREIASAAQRRQEQLEEQNERLRAALIAGRATHGELCHAGAECQFIRDANAALASLATEDEPHG